MGSTNPRFTLKPLTELNQNQKPSFRAVTELSLAGLLWGFGFVGTVWALGGLGPSSILFYRFSIAFFAGFLFLLLTKTSKNIYSHELRLTFIPGVFLWLTLFFQTTGLQTTTAINSSFITTLYVVLVPLCRAVTERERLNRIHWICVAIALLGTGLIVEIQRMSVLNWGDLLTLVCALFAAIHILVVGQRASRTTDDFAFNVFQSMWVAVFSLMALPFTSHWNLAKLNFNGWIGILSLGFGSSLIAFYLQVRSQKKISPSVVSLLFLLESPVSCFFAYIFLNERMGLSQWTGAGLILLACLTISFWTPNSAPTAPFPS